MTSYKLKLITAICFVIFLLAMGLYGYAIFNGVSNWSTW